MNKKKVAIVGAVGLPANYGGWETLVDNLTLQLQDRFDITVFCSSKRYNKKLKEFNGAKLKYINLNANGIQSIPYDCISIYQSLKFADTILVLGVSGCICLPLVRFFGISRIIVNIDGIEWKRGKWNKFAKLFLKISERFAVKFAHFLITDNEGIQNYVFEKYAVKSHLIAYGGDHVLEKKNTQFSDKYDFLSEDYIFSVCRIEPENNLDIILKAVSLLSSHKLVIIGNWSNSAYGSDLKKKYQKFQNLYLLDPIYDQVILGNIRTNCSLYVHGHSAGGTNPSLVEAMYLGLPIVAFDVEYNRFTTQNKSLYFKSCEQLIAILKDLDNINLRKVSSDMKSIALKEYTWPKITKEYANLL